MQERTERGVLGRGIYTVNEVCRVLPSITPRKVHYWLDKGMLGEAIRHGSPGRPTLLSFEQLLKIKTLQRLRDDLEFSLRIARQALDWMLANLVADEWHRVYLFRAGAREVGVTDSEGQTSFVIPTGQTILPGLVPGLNKFLEQTRGEWEQGFMTIAGYDLLVSDPSVLAGSPVIAGTRIETAFIANLAQEETLGDLVQLFPNVPKGALLQAAEFEHVEIAA